MKNGTFAFIYGKHCALGMRKTDGSDDVFGEYLLTGGEYYEKFTSKFSDNDGIRLEKDKLTVTMAEDKTTLYALERLDAFELKADTIITDVNADGEMKETPYQVEGDILKLYPSEGTERILTRKKET